MAQTEEQKKVVRRWVKALRSDQYKQGQGTLCLVGDKADSFCCLGVLNDMAVRFGVIEAPAEREKGCSLTYAGKDDYLSNKVMKWAGLKSMKGAYGPYSYSLARDNDSGKSFKQIAKVIESAPEGLFV